VAEDSVLKPGFVIMQIGNAQLDDVFQAAIAPAMRSLGLEPKRVDKHTEGELLKSEIIRFIDEAEIIVADLTNERPNCYLEVGFAMGRQKFARLILTARSDHAVDSPERAPNGPRVHFDLSGYDILFWNPSDLGTFRAELESKIRRRAAIRREAPSGSPGPLDSPWFQKHRAAAAKGLADAGLVGLMEFSVAVDSSVIAKTSEELLAAHRQAQVHTFGWPLGLLVDRPDAAPRPTSDGVVAEVSLPERSSYDYWADRRNGDSYVAASFFEDETATDKLFINTQIVRVTEGLMFFKRYYEGLGLPAEAVVAIRIRHSGIKHRFLGIAGGHFWPERGPCAETEMAADMTVTFDALGSNLVGLVKQVLEPIFELFDFFHLPPERYEMIVNSFVAGKPI
jgi:hypothetical protein